MKIKFSIQVIFLFTLALVGTMTGCSRTFTTSPTGPAAGPTNTPALTSTDSTTPTLSPTPNTSSTPGSTNTPTATGQTNTPTGSPTPTQGTPTCIPPDLGGPSYPLYDYFDTRVYAPGSNPGCSSALTYDVAGRQVNIFGTLAATAGGNSTYAGADWHYYDFNFYTANGEGWILNFGCFGSNQYSLITYPCNGPATYTGPVTFFGNAVSSFAVEVAVVGLSGTPGPYTLSAWEEGTPRAMTTPTPTGFDTPTPTATSTPTSSPTNTPTPRYTPTLCFPCSWTPTGTITPAATNTPTGSYTPTYSPTPTGTWYTPTPTPT
ncbi:MAG TPA: hypothetical protein VIJ93_02450 [bacterium]